MRAWLKIIALASVFVLIVPAIIPAPKAKASSSFIMGGDVSMLHEVEQRGGKFYDNGVRRMHWRF